MNYFRLGRVFGINIHVNWSWLLIFGLVSWSLRLTFAQIHPDWSINMQWAMAMLAAFLFFVSVLAHELAHSLVALSRGVPVSNITIFMLGGVANMQREPSSPTEEFVITVVGPLTSLFLGATGLVVGAAGTPLNAGSLTAPAVLSHLQPLGTILAWVGSVNILIGLFNLIPAFPLDGGRMIRALVWAISSDLPSATRWSAWLGQAIAWTIILGGGSMLFGVSLPFFGSGFFQGVWLIFIGCFLYNAALMGYRQTVIEDRLAAIPVRSVMQTTIPLISSRASLGDLLNRNLVQMDGHAVFVMEGQEVIGMVAMKDVKKSRRREWSSAAVVDIMTPISDLLYVTADDDIAGALERLQRFELRQIPVMFDNRVVGLLHRRDVNRLLQWQTKPGA